MKDHRNDPLSDVLAEALERQDMTKREQLARAMWMNTTQAPAEHWERENDITREIYRENVDAILAELREPDNRMLEAARNDSRRLGYKAAWQAMIDAISEGKCGD